MMIAATAEAIIHIGLPAGAATVPSLTGEAAAAARDEDTALAPAEMPADSRDTTGTTCVDGGGSTSIAALFPTLYLASIAADQPAYPPQTGKRRLRSFSNALLTISSSFGGRSGFSRTAGTGALRRIASKYPRRAFAAKRQRARSHLVKHYAQRKTIRTRVQILARACSGEHIRHRSSVLPGLVRCASLKASRLASMASPLRAMTLARPKSSTFARPRLVIKIFAGLISR